MTIGGRKAARTAQVVSPGLQAMRVCSNLNRKRLRVIGLDQLDRMAEAREPGPNYCWMDGGR